MIPYSPLSVSPLARLDGYHRETMLHAIATLAMQLHELRDLRPQHPIMALRLTEDQWVELWYRHTHPGAGADQAQRRLRDLEAIFHDALWIAHDYRDLDEQRVLRQDLADDLHDARLWALEHLVGHEHVVRHAQEIWESLINYRPLHEILIDLADRQLTNFLALDPSVVDALLASRLVLTDGIVARIRRFYEGQDFWRWSGNDADDDDAEVAPLTPEHQEIQDRIDPAVEASNREILAALQATVNPKPSACRVQLYHTYVWAIERDDPQRIVEAGDLVAACAYGREELEELRHSFINRWGTRFNVSVFDSRVKAAKQRWIETQRQRTGGLRTTPATRVPPWRTIPAEEVPSWR